MGKTTGFKEFSRAVEPYRPVKERLLDFKEIYTEHDDEKLSVQGQGAWIAEFRSVNLEKGVRFIT